MNIQTVGDLASIGVLANMAVVQCGHESGNPEHHLEILGDHGRRRVDRIFDDHVPD